MDSETLNLTPRISEQTYLQAEKHNVYVFDVPVAANKQQIKAAVEKQHKVTVTAVNVVVAKGKTKQSYQKRRQPITGRRSDIKKAYVSVKSGDKIPVYEEVN